jgi:hypothetical protein
MVAGLSGDIVYTSSEEASIRLISPELDRVWIPVGGHPVIARLKGSPGNDVVVGGKAIGENEPLEAGN